MNIIKSIIGATIIITISLLIQFLRYKFPVIFFNFEVEEGRNKYRINSEFYTKRSEEVKRYKERQKYNLKKLFFVELTVLVIYIFIQLIY